MLTWTFPSLSSLIQKNEVPTSRAYKTDQENASMLCIKDPGVPAVTWDQRCLCSTWTQVWSLTWHSGLIHLVLPPVWCGSQLQLRPDPWPGNSVCHGATKKKTKPKPKQNKEPDTYREFSEQQWIWTSSLIRSLFLVGTCSALWRGVSIRKQFWNFSETFYIRFPNEPISGHWGFKPYRKTLVRPRSTFLKGGRAGWQLSVKTRLKVGQKPLGSHRTGNSSRAQRWTRYAKILLGHLLAEHQSWWGHLRKQFETHHLREDQCAYLPHCNLLTTSHRVMAPSAQCSGS